MLLYLSNLGSNDSLSLKLLTQKLAILLALVLGHRYSDLVRLSLDGRTYTPEGVVLPCKGLAKQTRPGNEKSLQRVVISFFFRWLVLKHMRGPLLPSEPLSLLLSFSWQWFHLINQ